MCTDIKPSSEQLLDCPGSHPPLFISDSLSPQIYALVKRTQPLKWPSVTMEEPTGATRQAGSSPHRRFCLQWDFIETVENDGRGPPCWISEGLQRPGPFIGALHRVDGEQRVYFFLVWPPLVDILGIT